MWQPQVHAFAEAGYFVLAPDLLGHGKSSRVQSLALEDWVHQIEDLLREKHLDRCILLGVSMGGVIAQSFVVDNPESVSALVLCDTFGELRTWQEKVQGFAPIVGFHIGRLIGTNALAKLMSAPYRAAFAQRARAYFSEAMVEADLDQLILARKAINRIDVLEELSTIDVPSLVMVGDQFGTSFVDINRKVADAIPGSEFVILEKAMDPSNLVNPAAFNREVLRFLAKGTS
jgi:pimeloyl-ACP methyl ester carboxylesterase